MKFELQYQNMIGRTVIATVAVSLKSYFASLHSFQNRVAELQNALKENNLNIEVNTYDAINFINQLLDITFAGKNGEILTLSNIASILWFCFFRQIFYIQLLHALLLL